MWIDHDIAIYLSQIEGYEEQKQKIMQLTEKVCKDLTEYCDKYNDLLKKINTLKNINDLLTKELNQPA